MKSLLLPLACLMLTRQAAWANAPRCKLTVVPILLNGNDDMNRLETAGCLNSHGQVARTQLVRAGSCSAYRTVLWQKGHALRTMDMRPMLYNGDNSSCLSVFAGR